MIISAIFGGLGNQMFQYARGLSLAKSTEKELTIDCSLQKSFASKHNGFELNNVFNIQTRECSKSELGKIIGFAAYSKRLRKLLSHPRLRSLRNSSFICEDAAHTEHIPQKPLKPEVYLCGYWQSEKYFIEHAKTIRSTFKFPRLRTAQDVETENQIVKLESVSLHIRRGDYISNPKAAATHGSCSITYYKDAIKHIERQIHSPHFFIFSDDMDWAKSKISPIINQATLIEGHHGSESYRDMQLMSQCKHHIIANSSFSWWGSWLNSSSEKIVVAPRAWFADGSTPPNLIPEKWLRI